MATLKPDELDAYGDLVAVALAAVSGLTDRKRILPSPNYARQLALILRDVELAKMHRGRVRAFEVELPTLRAVQSE